jgi:hypothetical protein
MNHFPVPHNAKLERAIEPGQLVTIRGRMLDVSTDGDQDPRLTVNFASGGQGYDTDSIPFHMAFRFKENATVMDTKTDNDWKGAQRKSLPLKLGEPFDIRIRCHGDKFDIMVDQKEFAEYEHVVPLTQVSHIFIDGPIVLEAVNWGGKYYSVPYESGISGGFGPGKRLMLSGIPESNAQRFQINLMTNDGAKALHFNPRFDEKAVVRNTQQKGEWEKEEREGDFPFMRDQAFDLVILNEQYSLQVYVNGAQICAYAHRVDPNEISGIMISGDMELQSIMVV